MNGPEVAQGRLVPAVDPERDHVRGPEDAPVTLVEYGDFLCPHCAGAQPVVRRVLERMDPRVRFVFRHFPVEHAHPGARLAAEAAEAAAAQGAFWPMHDGLFGLPDEPTEADVVEIAEELGLDADRIRDDLEEGVHGERVEQDLDAGIRSGVNGTPTFFVDGVRHDGDWSEEALTRALEAAAGAPDEAGRGSRDVASEPAGAPGGATAVRSARSLSPPAIGIAIIPMTEIRA